MTSTSACVDILVYLCTTNVAEALYLAHTIYCIVRYNTQSPLGAKARMKLSFHDWKRKVLLPLVTIIFVSCVSQVLGLQNFSNPITAIGEIVYPSSILRGVSWYGLDSNPSWYEMNKEYFDFMVQTFPAMTFLSLPVSANTIMPEIENGDYNTIDYSRLSLLKDFVSWSKPHGIKILVSNYWESTNEVALKAYWKFMAQQFLDENTIVGFDLINEPWAFAHGNEGLIDLYERIIDAIRSVDPYRACFVQSMYYHYQTAEWRNVLLTNPVNRSNVVYTTHLYSQDAATGEWYDSYTSPWIPYYLNHDYGRAKQVLKNTTEGGHGGLYQRFGFIKQELGYPVAVTEVATIDTEEGHQYLRDVLDILNEWNINWTYHPWYTNIDRPISLTYPNGTVRPKSTIVRDAM